jgi:hypothetical protein
VRVLDGANTWSLTRPGYESSARSAQLVRRWGLPRESAPGRRIGDEEVLKGRRFG